MAKIGQAFRDAAAQVQDDITNTEMYDDFMPPCTPGGTPYACLFAGLRTSRTDKEGKPPVLGVYLDWQIMDGEYQGRNFTTGFWSSAAWAMAPLFNLTADLTGDPSHVSSKLLIPAAEALAEFEGKVVIEVLLKLQTDRKGEVRTKWTFPRILDKVED